jgi:hypothetical protein
MLYMKSKGQHEAGMPKKHHEKGQDISEKRDNVIVAEEEYQEPAIWIYNPGATSHIARHDCNILECRTSNQYVIVG